MSETDESVSTEAACWDKPHIGYLYIYIAALHSSFQSLMPQHQATDQPNDGKHWQKHK